MATQGELLGGRL